MVDAKSENVSREEAGPKVWEAGAPQPGLSMTPAPPGHPSVEGPKVPRGREPGGWTPEPSWRRNTLPPLPPGHADASTTRPGDSSIEERGGMVGGGGGKKGLGEGLGWPAITGREGAGGLWRSGER